MGLYTHTRDPIGCFCEREAGNSFEYSLNTDSAVFCEDFPHIIWVGDSIGSPYRYGIVKKTVAYVAVDEDEFGLPVLERWDLSKNTTYSGSK